MFLKKLESWLERGQKVPFWKEICSPKKCTPKIGANIGAITGILLTAFMLWPSYNGHFWGYFLFRGISPSKIGHIAPF
jgi:hypothetical protein